jgi:Cu/Ag efflux protein CusF
MAEHVRTWDGQYNRRGIAMKRTGFALLAGLFILSIAAGGWAAEPPSWATDKMIEATATVQAVDQSTRMVTLKGPKGNSITFKAADEVRNLAQLKVGDQVTFTYFQSVAVRVLKEGESFPKASESKSVSRAKKGETPGGEVEREKSFNFTINAIDKEAKNVTLIDKDGKLLTVQPLRPEKLDEVKLGDRLVVTYSDLYAVKVEPAAKKK